MTLNGAREGVHSIDSLQEFGARESDSAIKQSADTCSREVMTFNIVMFMVIMLFFMYVIQKINIYAIMTDNDQTINILRRYHTTQNNHGSTDHINHKH
jgi:hypothetical protein